MSTVLVVGARPGSLGDVIRKELAAQGFRVEVGGITRERHTIDLMRSSFAEIARLLQYIDPKHIICTAGVNEPTDSINDPAKWYAKHFAVNVTGPMRLLEGWRALGAGREGVQESHFVAISSNSARVPRTGSAAYCASKAALSMALRCVAREVSADPSSRLSVYGYEPGLVAGTPMTEQTASRYPRQALTRMRPAELSEGVSAGALARLVVAGLRAGRAMNGLLVPFDADEA
jgi:NAD(P)-dependent dehydrogenase (short-subunit alcohol dehydrogenase family)